jgi:hypothetical protein
MSSSTTNAAMRKRVPKAKNNSQLIGGKSFMVADSSGDGMASSIPNESAKGNHGI